LDYCGIHALRGEVKRVLILAPRIAIEVWESQIDKHFPYHYLAQTFDEEWTRGYWKTDLPSVQFFLAGREETFRRTKGPDGYLRPKQDLLEDWNPDVIIVDESHEYGRPGGVGAQDLWRLVRRLRKTRSKGRPWVLLLTGTPKEWLSIFSQFRIMDETLLGTNAGDFKDKHIIYGHGKRKFRVMAYRKTKKLKRVLRENSFAISAEEAGLANEKFFEKLHVQLPPSIKQLYLELAEEFIVELENGMVLDAPNAGVKRIRLLQLCGGFTTDGTEIHRAKVDKAHAYLSLLHEQGESVVVYARFSAEVDACASLLRTVGYRSFQVDGRTKGKDRSRAIKALETRPSTPTAIAFQHQAGSRAIELVGAAEVVYYSPPDGWVDYFQTLNRVAGPNQHRPIRYTHLVAPGTVDVSVIRGLQSREDFHAGLMRNPRRYLLGL
jgi:hypothetical protein